MEQSVVILWVNWRVNKYFWQRFTCTTAVFLFQDLLGHLDELIVYILYYTWIRMAEIVQNPFDGHKHYDIDVRCYIDTELYAATAALHF